MNLEEETIEISNNLKKAGFIYRKPDYSHSKFKLCMEICNKIQKIDLRDMLDVNIDEKEE